MWEKQWYWPPGEKQSNGWPPGEKQMMGTETVIAGGWG